MSESMITSVIVHLDDTVPESMNGILRIGSLDYHSAPVPDLVDNKEFHDEQEILNYVASQLGIASSIIEIV